MSKISQNRKKVSSDKMDRKIERGEIDPENGFYARGILNILNMLFKEEKFQRPRGKNMPIFTEAEMTLLVIYIFFKPEGWEVRPFPILHKPIKEDIKRYDKTIKNVIQKEYQG